MSSFIDSVTGLVLFVQALVLSSENYFMIAKLMIWVEFGVADKLFNMCLQMLVKNRLHGKAAPQRPQHALMFLSHCVGKVLLTS